jgi:O-antigen/teichoic acid export membrane protein
VVPGILQLFPALGLNVAATRYMAFLYSRGQQDTAKLLVSKAIFLVSAFGLLLSVAGFLLAGFASSYLLHRDSLVPYIRILSISVIGQAVIQMGTSIAIGRYAMRAAVATNILQSGVKLLAAPLLLVAGFGLAGAVAGYAVSFIVAAAFIVLVLANHRDFVQLFRIASPLRETGEMLRYAFPAFLGSLLTGVSAYYLPVILAGLASDVAIGNFQAAYNVLVPLTLLSSAVAMTLFPAIASLEATGGDVAGVFKDTVRYFGYLSIPMLMLLVGCARQLMYILYGASFRPGAGYLALLCLTATPTLFGLNVTPSFFNGAGKTKTTLIIVGLGACAFLLLAPFLSEFRGMGIGGLILALFVSNAISTVAGVYFARIQFHTNLDYFSALATLTSSLLGLASTLIVPAFASATVVVVLKSLIFGAVYMTLAPLLGAVRVVDLDRLKESLEGFPVIGRMAVLLIAYQKRVAAHSLRDASDSSNR